MIDLGAGKFVCPRLDGLAKMVVGELTLHCDIASALFRVVCAMCLAKVYFGDMDGTHSVSV